jgi:hypothetical protein
MIPTTPAAMSRTAGDENKINSPKSGPEYFDEPAHQIKETRAAVPEATMKVELARTARAKNNAAENGRQSAAAVT